MTLTRVTKIGESGWLESLNQWLIYNSEFRQNLIMALLSIQDLGHGPAQVIFSQIWFIAFYIHVRYVPSRGLI